MIIRKKNVLIRIVQKVISQDLYGPDFLIKICIMGHVINYLFEDSLHSYWAIFFLSNSYKKLFSTYLKKYFPSLYPKNGTV